MPIGIPMAMLGSAALSAAGSIGGGWLSSQGGGETKLQRQRSKLVDKIISSLDGNGPYSDLFSMDENSFQKSVVDPAKSRFRNQIAPAIQEQYITSGQHRGTGLEDTLTRAGVDMDSLINQEYMKFYQSGLDRKQNTLMGITGGSEAPYKPSTSQALGQATSGYLNSDAFSNTLDRFSNSLNQPQTQARKGYVDDWSNAGFNSAGRIY